MAKIIAPTKGYKGTSASVTFKDGVGYTDNPHLIDWFKGKGYGVELDASELALPVPEPEPDPIEDLQTEPEVITEAPPEPDPEIPPVEEAAAEPEKKASKKGGKK